MSKQKWQEERESLLTISMMRRRKAKILIKIKRSWYFRNFKSFIITIARVRRNKI